VLFIDITPASKTPRCCSDWTQAKLLNVEQRDLRPEDAQHVADPHPFPP
jgi:hypothetical protein